MGWSECDVWLDCWYNRNRRSIGVYSKKWLESLEEVVNKDTDKEAHVPASVFIIADCWLHVQFILSASCGCLLYVTTSAKIRTSKDENFKIHNSFIRRTLLRYVRLMARAVRPSVCRLSVTLVPSTHCSVELFGNIFARSNSLGTWKIDIKFVGHF